MRRLAFSQLCILLIGASTVTEGVSAREMIYRRDVVHPPGYNSGSGRFVDQDRSFALEVDAYTPAKASLTSDGDNKVQEWGAELQYNLGPVAIGPEFWFGHYAKDGQDNSGAFLLANESYEILYNQYQLLVTAFSQRQQMRGWYAKGGFSYTKIDAETNLRQEREDSAVVAYTNLDETRQGFTVAGGRRFTFLQNRCSLNLGVSYTKTSSRSLESTDDKADARYASILANAGDKRLAVKDFPEIRLAVGFLF